MSVGIRVCRNSTMEGCSLDDESLDWGPDVIDSLLNNVTAAQERGRVEIEREYSNRLSITGTSADTTILTPGKLYKVDGDFEEIGMLRKQTIVISQGEDTVDSDSTIILEGESP